MAYKVAYEVQYFLEFEEIFIGDAAVVQLYSAGVLLLLYTVQVKCKQSVYSAVTRG